MEGQGNFGMIGKVFGILCLVSVGYGIFVGNGEALSGAILEGAEKTVELILFLWGSMALWNGVLAVLKEVGAVRLLSKLLSPLLRVAFPGLPRTSEGEDIREDIACCLGANMLGIGNAATPFALSALGKMQRHNQSEDSPTADMVTLTVLNTAPFCLLPTTVMAFRQEAGSTSPYSVLVPIWIASLATFCFALLLTGVAGRVEAIGGRRTEGRVRP